jgi:hypothetical protein
MLVHSWPAQSAKKRQMLAIASWLAVVLAFEAKHAHGCATCCLPQQVGP